MNLRRQASMRQEKLIADALGARVVSGSGARHLHPGDVISEKWLGECKTHVNPGHKIQFKIDVWSKIHAEAQSRFKYPILFVDDGSQTLDKTWVMFSQTVALPEGAVVGPLPIPVKQNVSFDSDTLYNRVVVNTSEPRMVVYQLNNWQGYAVNICNFRYFEEAYGGMM